MSVCCVLSGTGLWEGPVTVQRSHTMCDVSECDREASKRRRSWPTGGCCAMGGNTKYFVHNTLLHAAIFRKYFRSTMATQISNLIAVTRRSEKKCRRHNSMTQWRTQEFYSGEGGFNKFS